MKKREFLKMTGLSAVAGAAIHRGLFTAAEAEEVRDRVNTHSEPTKLRITDLRVVPCLGSHILRLDTNQGISGYGEVRDVASATYALMLKSRVLGENPCNVDKIFRKIKQFGGHSRQAGGVVAVEIACWDLAGKAWGAPCWQMLGGRFRDRVRLYADTPSVRDPQEMGRRLKERRQLGFTCLKMDVGTSLLRGLSGALSSPAGAMPSFGGGSNLPGPMLGIRITDKGLKGLQDYVAAVREVVGWDVPLAADHFGNFAVEDAIKLAQAMDPYNLAWLEDMLPWFCLDDYVRLKNSCKTPLATGEDIYLKEEFIKLFEKKAISICHPDLATSGGLLETKKIGDAAQEHNIPMAMHMAGTPILMYASIHCAAATENFLALEHHGIDIAGYDDLISGVPKPIMAKDGFVPVPQGPGLGIELNVEAIKEMLRRRRMDPDKLYFPPTDQWNNERSRDRYWSRIEMPAGHPAA
jgi:L-alanine-DL-glutamate epimerase-like enolase superfamily enzyme